MPETGPRFNPEQSPEDFESLRQRCRKEWDRIYTEPLSYAHSIAIIGPQPWHHIDLYHPIDRPTTSSEAVNIIEDQGYSNHWRSWLPAYLMKHVANFHFGNRKSFNTELILGDIEL